MAVSHYIDTFTGGAKKFWHDFDIKKLSERIGGSSAEAVEAAIYFVLSFVVGFLFKKYFKFIFVCCIVSVLLIKGFEYTDYLTINWDAVKASIGLGGEQATDFNAVMNNVLDWFKNHLLLAIASIIGFLVGYKLG